MTADLSHCACLSCNSRFQTGGAAPGCLLHRKVNGNVPHSPVGSSGGDRGVSATSSAGGDSGVSAMCRESTMVECSGAAGGNTGLLPGAESVGNRRVTCQRRQQYRVVLVIDTVKESSSTIADARGLAATRTCHQCRGATAACLPVLPAPPPPQQRAAPPGHSGLPSPVQQR